RLRASPTGAGSMVLLPPYVPPRHPAFWEAPAAFDPDRFTPVRAVGRPSFAYFPFGGGPRHCIGSAFATTEMQLIVAAVAQRYQLTLERGLSVTPAAGLTLRPSPALPSRLHPLSSRGPTPPPGGRHPCAGRSTVARRVLGVATLVSRGGEHAQSSVPPRREAGVMRESG